MLFFLNWVSLLCTLRVLGLRPFAPNKIELLIKTISLNKESFLRLGAHRVCFIMLIRICVGFLEYFDLCSFNLNCH